MVPSPPVAISPGAGAGAEVAFPELRCTQCCLHWALPPPCGLVKAWFFCRPCSTLKGSLGTPLLLISGVSNGVQWSCLGLAELTGPWWPSPFRVHRRCSSFQTLVPVAAHGSQAGPQVAALLTLTRQLTRTLSSQRREFCTSNAGSAFQTHIYNLTLHFSWTTSQCL